MQIVELNLSQAVYRRYGYNNLNTGTLFPAISLLLLAYTNRFLALAALVRQLHGQYQEHPDDILFG